MGNIRLAGRAISSASEKRMRLEDRMSKPKLNVVLSWFVALTSFVPTEVLSDTKDEARLGKYLCFVSDMVGIHIHDANNTTEFSGKIQPSEEKFFVTVSRNDKRSIGRACSNEEYLSKISGSIQCSADYKLESETNISIAPTYYGDNTYLFMDARTGRFHLFATGYFSSSWISPVGSYSIRGKCEKIN
jgi:hypothetical protein